MPTPQPYMSPTRRANLIAATMALLLVASLAGAYAVVRSRAGSWATAVLSKSPQRVGDLRLMLPRQWELSTSRSAPEGLRPGAVFEDPEEPTYRLTIGLLPCGATTTPAAALNAALNVMLEEEDRTKVRRIDLAAISASPMVGLRYAGLNKDETNIQEHLLAAMTEDGRRYWLLHLTRSLPKAKVSDRRLEDDRKLFDAMVGTMLDTGFRKATPADLRSAGLPSGEGAPAWPENLDLRATANAGAGAPIRVVPRDALDRLRFLRIRAVPDFSYADAPRVLAPDVMLTTEAVRMLGQPPAANQVAEETIAGVPVWRTEISPIDPSGGEPTLIRQLWLARIAPGKAVLIEAVAEPVARARTVALGESIVKALAAPAPGAGKSGDVTAADNPGLKAAVDRGEKLVALMRKDLDKRLAPGWRYELIDRLGIPLGFTITRFSLLRGNDPMPLRGLYSMALAGLSSQAEWEWAASRDGQRFVIESLEGSGGPRLNPSGWTRSRLELHSGKLTLNHGPAVGAKSMKMEQPAPPALIPPMTLHAWPEEFLHDAASTPAVVWIAWGGEAPAAYWVDRPRAAGSPPGIANAWAPPPPAKPSAKSPPSVPGLDFTPDREPGDEPVPPDLPLAGPAATGPDADVSVQLLLWPMMGMEPTRLGFDLHGRLIRADLGHQAGTATDPDGVSRVAVDRATLLKRYSKLQSKFDEWDKKELSP
ncbi:MAG: hypothetical protein NTW19_09390 [Planctomycetota bacterium]|nr:hypothetical protein [Planctomycetota bacterium]